MRIALFLGSYLFSMSALGTDAYQDTVSSENLSAIRIDLQYLGETPELALSQDSGTQWQTLNFEKQVSWLPAGQPDLPAFRKLIAVDPDKHYQIKAVYSEPLVLTGIKLRPAVADRLENDSAAKVFADSQAYLENRELGSDGVALESDSTIGGVRVLGLRLHPLRYNPVKQELTVYRSARVDLISSDKDPDNFTVQNAFSKFQAAQIRSLVSNGAAVLNRTPTAALSTVFVITSASLLTKARQLAQSVRLPNVIYEFATTSAVTGSSATVKQLIKDRYGLGGLDAVLIFGDETQVSLHAWSSSLPGDSFYGLIEGDDNYADIALGRLPVTTEAEADIITNKIARFSELQNLGQINKRVLLTAHKENYPGKYTGNMERVRNAANPAEFEFVTQYGGAGGTNAAVVDLINDQQGFGLITYRGHGSDTAWTGWDRNGQSFSKTQVAGLSNVDEKLAIFLSIACNNGAIQRSYNALAEEMLFYQNAALPNQGAVGFLGATIESYTDVNHNFIENIFRLLQSEAEIPMGQVVATASNQLVRDNGGSMPANVKMYIYFGEPMLQPWLK